MCYIIYSELGFRVEIVHDMMKELTLCLGFFNPCPQDASEKKMPKEGIQLLVCCTELPLFPLCILNGT